MNYKIEELLKQITVLEDELRTVLANQQSSIHFQVKGKRIEFEQSIKQTHQKLQKTFFAG